MNLTLPWMEITAPTCGPVCGNGVVEAGEECDGAAPGAFLEIAGPPGAGRHHAVAGADPERQ
jgi:hypothetical protein